MKGDYYDDKLERDVYSYKSCGICLFGIIVALLLSFLCGSCSPKVITVPEVHTEYVYKTDSFVQRDSVYINDSVFIREKGDTVWVEKFKTIYRDRFRDIVSVDTVLKCDTIPQIVEVEKSLTWWQEKKIEFGEIAMVGMALLLVFALLRLKFK